jgi:hypothetical protein
MAAFQVRGNVLDSGHVVGAVVEGEALTLFAHASSIPLPPQSTSCVPHISAALLVRRSARQISGDLNSFVATMPLTWRANVWVLGSIPHEPPLSDHWPSVTPECGADYPTSLAKAAFSSMSSLAVNPRKIWDLPNVCSLGKISSLLAVSGSDSSKAFCEPTTGEM